MRSTSPSCWVDVQLWSHGMYLNCTLVMARGNCRVCTCTTCNAMCVCVCVLVCAAWVFCYVCRYFIANREALQVCQWRNTHGYLPL